MVANVLIIKGLSPGSAASSSKVRRYMDNVIRSNHVPL